MDYISLQAGLTGQPRKVTAILSDSCRRKWKMYSKCALSCMDVNVLILYLSYVESVCTYVLYEFIHCMFVGACSAAVNVWPHNLQEFALT